MNNRSKRDERARAHSKSFPGEIGKSILVVVGVEPTRVARIARKKLPPSP
jgi:hypothetical protein